MTSNHDVRPRIFGSRREALSALAALVLASMVVAAVCVLVLVTVVDLGLVLR